MPTESGVTIRGMRELQRAFARAPLEARREVRSAFSEVAQPIKRDAESYAQARIRRIGTKWPLMRIGVTRSVVYVAPKQRGAKRRRGETNSHARPNLADLLMGRAMEPALMGNAGEIEHGVERALDRLADHFNAERF